MINIRPDEISNIIRQQIESYDQDVKIDNIGTVLQIGDGIARVYGLEQVMNFTPLKSSICIFTCECGCSSA